MKVDALLGPDFFCIGCTIAANTITAEIAWTKPGVAGQTITLQAPKQPESPTYRVVVPVDIDSLHTEVTLRVCPALENPN